MIKNLEAKLAHWERKQALHDAVDQRLEVALRERQPLERVMPSLLHILAQHLGARAAACRTLDESLAERMFVHGDAAITPELLQAAESETASVGLSDGGVAQIHQIDVAGEAFGQVFAFFEVEPSDEAAELIECFSELLDNHLAAIAHARRKYEVIRSISDALKEPVLDRGIAHAIEILERHVKFDGLILMFRHEDDLEAGGLRYQVYDNGALTVDSSNMMDKKLDVFIRSRARAFFDGDDSEIRDRFNITRYREELLITGVRAMRVVGRILVTSRQGEFHTYDRELLDRFADYLRQRIVDFNREWKHLTRMFSIGDSERLLREEAYVARWLTPREQDVAIFYGDIVGFTRMSEQVFRTPEAIGRLIDTWANGVVDIIWSTGGVFDKMIGDCIIGLWGPPFFERSAKEECERAIDAAQQIRELTRRLIENPNLPGLAKLDRPLEIAIGMHYAHCSVGLFGPSENYTAFSSGMNNTARLQGIAEGGEILCMEPFVEALGARAKFSDLREAEVKNVAEPLRYRALRSE